MKIKIIHNMRSTFVQQRSAASAIHVRSRPIAHHLVVADSPHLLPQAETLEWSIQSKVGDTRWTETHLKFEGIRVNLALVDSSFP